MEEYSEDKIHKSESEPGNGDVNTLLIRPEEILESLARSLSVTMNEHAIANVCLYLSLASNLD